MELRTVNPKLVRENPDNPRAKTKPDHADEQMRLSIAAVGILQPPVVRETLEGLTVRYGNRRVRAARALKLPQIDVLVLGEDEREDDDAMRAVLENVVRKEMTPVDQWRAVEKLVSERWTEEAISNVLALPLRTIRKLRLLARLHPPMLDAIAAGSMPNEHQTRVIAAASAEEQEQAWKAHKPKRGAGSAEPGGVAWFDLARALEKRRIPYASAKFDEAAAAQYGVTWHDDLFVPAGEDSRYTTDVEAFMAAQQAWLDANLPPNGAVLAVNEYGRPELPRGTDPVYGAPGADDVLGHYLDRDGHVRTQAYRFRPTRRAEAGSATGGADDTDGLADVGGTDRASPAKVRPEVTQKGHAMIGAFRTDALHRALREADIPDHTLIGLLVVAFSGLNVTVQTGENYTSDRRAEIARSVSEGGVVTTDPDTLRAAARAVLATVLSCRDNMTNSGYAARVAGETVGASSLLPNMATDEFLSCLSKPGLERVAREQGVRVEATAKLTRGNFVGHFRESAFVHPESLFGLTETDRRNEAERQRRLAEMQQRYGARPSYAAGPESTPDAAETGAEDDTEEEPTSPDNDEDSPAIAAE